MKIVVIGAGPAGVAALRALPDTAVCLGRGRDVGGMCDVWRVAGHPFDLGGHFLHPTRPDFVQQAALALGSRSQELVTQKRRAFVHFEENYVPYPFQHHVGWLSAERRGQCISALDAVPPAKIATLADELETRFGPGVVSMFLEPYVNKSWGLSLFDLDPVLAEDRIEGSEREEMRRMWSTRDEHRPRRNPHVHYPASGIFADIYRSLADPVRSRILTRRTVRHMSIPDRELHLPDGNRLSFDHLVCSLPLDSVIDSLLASPAQGVEPPPPRPTFLSAPLLLAALVYDRRDDRNWHRLYFAEDDIPFHKLCLHHNDAPVLREPGTSLMLAELNPRRAPSGEEAVRACDEAIRRLRLVPRQAKLLSSDLRETERAYPLRRPGERDLYEAWMACLAKQRVHMVGRWGRWQYWNSDEVYVHTQLIAGEINGH